MKTFIFTLFLASNLFSLGLDAIPQKVILQGDDGGKTDGTLWDSSTLKDKVFVVFYVDPDEKDTNNNFSEALKEKKFDLNNYGSVAIVNMAATWMPNIAIESKLKSKQKKFPNALYIKDKKKVLVKKWNLEDDASNVAVFGKDGKVLYFKSGKLDKNEIDKVLRLIEDNL